MNKLRIKNKKRIIVAVSFLTVLLILTLGTVFATDDGSAGKEDGSMNLLAKASGSLFDISESSVFHDQAIYFLSDVEPEVGDTLTIRLRAEKNSLQSAKLQYCLEGSDVFTSVDMIKSSRQFDATDDYEYWEASVETPNTMFYYRFHLTKNSFVSRYYCSSGSGDNYNVISSSASDSTCCWKIKPGFTTPDWAKGTTWYSLMPDAFYNGDTTNDDHDSDNNYDQPWNLTHNGLSDKYGGDLQGIMDKIEYIKSLGVSGICYNPITVAEQNAGYGSFNQNQIENALGNAQTYSEFIQLMHENDLKLIQDVAIYHTMRESIYYNANNRWPVMGYEQGTNSPYYNMFLQPLQEAWGGLALNNASEATKMTLWSTPEAPMARYINDEMGYGVDGYRFDLGGDITGTDSAGNRVDNVSIISEMRNYLKSINEDVLFISESSSNTQLVSGAWDGQWNLELGNQLREYASDGLALFYMRNHLAGARHSQLRGVALCSHNQLTTHDLYGVRYDGENNDSVNAAKMIQMTALGSPSIYYGEEVNYAGRQFSSSQYDAEGFSYFNWDESEWDYDVLNYHKALLELRNQFTSLKDGAIYELVRPENTDDDFYAFGRFDSNGAVVTYLNSSEASAQKEVKVSYLGVADGTVMTDWFSGQKYTVTNGKIIITVPTGGTIIVTGSQKSSYVDGESVAIITADGYRSDTPGNIVVEQDIVSITIPSEDNYSIDGTNDTLKYIYNPLYNNYSRVVRVVDANNGDMIFMARNSLDSNSIYYGVVVAGDEISIIARERTGHAGSVILSNVGMGNATHIKIERKSNNEFVTYLGVEGNSGISYTTINGSECYLMMDACNYVGTAALSGTISYKPMETVSNGRTLYDDFTGPVATSLLNGVEETNAIIEEGKLIVPAQSVLTTKGMENDWTFKAKISYTPTNENDYAGVICKQDDDSYIIVGRIKTDNAKKVFFAKASNGELVIEYLANDTQTASDIVVQLQRIGTAYTAVYSYDGVAWNSLGNSVFYNLSDENVGIVVSGHADAEFDYVSFGNAIHDGSSFNAPRTPDKDVELSGGEYNQTYKWTAVTGNWSMIAEGLYQSEPILAQMAVNSGVYDSFRAEATFELMDGATWAGMSFGKETYNGAASEGYLLKYTSDGQLVLAQNGNVKASCDSRELVEPIRVVLECMNDRIKVYIGQDATPVMNIVTENPVLGYFSFCTNGPAKICNYNVGAVNVPIYTSGKAKGYADKLVVYDSGNSSVETTAFLREIGYTDFILTTSLTMHVEDDSRTAKAGIVFNSSYGLATETSDNVRLSYSKDGVLSLTENGTDLCNAYTFAEAPNSIDLLIVKQNGHYSIYIKDVTQPVLEFSENVNRGGVIAFFTLNSTTEFDCLKMNELYNSDDITQNSIYVNWTQGLAKKVNTFQDDFTSTKLLGSDYLAYNGTWDISQGTLKTTSHSTNYYGVTYVGNEYKDFVLTFKMKRSSVETNPGFVGVSFRKMSPKDAYDESGVTLGFYTNTISLIKKSSADVTTEYQDNVTNYNFISDVWHNIKIVCEGTSFKVYSDDVLVYQGVDNEYSKGYITFRSGKTPVEFDDVKIISLSDAPEYLTSDRYSFDSDIMYGVVDNTTVGMLLDNINESTHVKVLKNGTELDSSSLVGTGTIVAIVENNQRVKEYMVVIKGDVNGDGRITISDSTVTISHVLGKKILTGARRLAADANGNGNITVSDVVWINKKILEE